VAANVSRACLRTGQPGGAGLHGEQPDAVAGAGGDEDQVGGGAVQDEVLLAVQDPAVARPRRRRADRGLRPHVVALRDRECGPQIPGGDRGQVLLLRVAVAREQQRGDAEHRGGEERRGKQRTAHLLQDDAEFHVPGARPAQFLRDEKPRQAQHLGHLPPHLGVEALGGLRESAHLRLGRPVLQEGPHRTAQRVVFLCEHQGHGVRPLA
jgi:hypothetical protein